jgi:hypothetical protein
MDSFAHSALTASVLASVLGALIMCALVWKYGFPSSAEDFTERRLLITRVGHAIAGACFATTGVLAIVALSSGARATPVATATRTDERDASPTVEIHRESEAAEALALRLAEMESRVTRIDDEVRRSAGRVDEIEKSAVERRSTATAQPPVPAPRAAASVRPPAIERPRPATAVPPPSSPPLTIASTAVPSPSSPPPTIASTAVPPPSSPPPPTASTAVPPPSSPPPTFASTAVPPPSSPPPPTASTASTESGTKPDSDGGSSALPRPPVPGPEPDRHGRESASKAMRTIAAEADDGWRTLVKGMKNLAAEAADAMSRFERQVRRQLDERPRASGRDGADGVRR